MLDDEVFIMEPDGELSRGVAKELLWVNTKSTKVS
jgi:hypothetical protein